MIIWDFAYTDLGGCKRGRVPRQHAVAVAGQLEVSFDFRQQQADDIAGRGDPVPGPGLLGHARSTDGISSFEHQHFPTGGCQVGRTDQAIVAGADDHAVIRRRHDRSRPASPRRNPRESLPPRPLRSPHAPTDKRGCRGGTACCWWLRWRYVLRGSGVSGCSR